MSYNSTELISQLKNGSSDAYNPLYEKSYPSVEKFIVNNSGTVNDAKDIFQDTLLVLFKKVREDNFELTASLKTYVIAISKNLWFKKLRHISNQQETSLTDFHSNKFFCEIESAILKEKSYWERLQIYLTKISSHCNNLLKSMFFKSKTIEDIQLEYGYTSKHNAQNQKHKCLQQVRKVKEVQESN